VSETFTFDLGTKSPWFVLPKFFGGYLAAGSCASAFPRLSVAPFFGWSRGIRLSVILTLATEDLSLASPIDFFGQTSL
jgi:hypothetical protein